MKKSIKMLALGLAVVPCALAMTACGNDDTGLVNSKASYKAAETTQYSAVINDLEEKGVNLETAFAGMRAVMTIDVEADFFGQEIEMSMKSDTKVKSEIKDGTISSADLIAAQTNTVTLEMGKEKASLGANLYITDGREYCDLSDIHSLLASVDMAEILPMPEKFYMNLNFGDETISLDSFKISNYIAQIPEGEYGNAIKVATYEKDDTYKVKVTIDSGLWNLPQYTPGTEEQISVKEMSDLELYFVFSNGNLVGIEAEMEADIVVLTSLDGTTVTPTTFEVEANLEIVPYTGEISIPSADNLATYVEFDPTVE